MCRLANLCVDSGMSIFKPDSCISWIKTQILWHKTFASASLIWVT